MRGLRAPNRRCTELAAALALGLGSVFLLGSCALLAGLNDLGQDSQDTPGEAGGSTGGGNQEPTTERGRGERGNGGSAPEVREDPRPQEGTDPGEDPDEDPGMGGARGEDGEDEKVAPPLLTSFSATKTELSPGDSVFLQWTVGGGEPTRVSLEPDIGVSLGADDRSVTIWPRRTARYQLTVENAAGSNSLEVAVKMTPGGTVDGHHTFAGKSIPAALAISPSGRVVSLQRGYGDFTVGPITVRSSDFYLAEHDIDANDVLLLSLPNHVLEGWDIAFDGEELIVTGSNLPLSSPGSDSIAVERLNHHLQRIDSVDYRVNIDFPETGKKLALGPKGEIFVLAFSSIIASSVSRLSADLEVLGGVAYPPGIFWEDLTVDQQGVTYLLRSMPSGEVDVVKKLVDGAPVESMAWTAPSNSTVSAMGRYSIGGLVVVGQKNDYGFTQLIQAPGSASDGAYQEYPSDLATAPYDELEFVDLCFSDSDRVLVLGKVTVDEQTDLFVQSFAGPGDYRATWKEPIIWGSKSTEVLPVAIACDSQGYAYVVGAEQPVGKIQASQWEPFILRIR